jgi:hypothetical protein
LASDDRLVPFMLLPTSMVATIPTPSRRAEKCKNPSLSHVKLGTAEAALG